MSWRLKLTDWTLESYIQEFILFTLSSMACDRCGSIVSPARGLGKMCWAHVLRWPLWTMHGQTLLFLWRRNKSPQWHNHAALCQLCYCIEVSPSCEEALFWAIKLRFLSWEVVKSITVSHKFSLQNLLVFLYGK